VPDGRTHDALTLVAASFAAPICVGLTFDGNPGRAALALGSFLVSGLLFSDDLDTHSIEHERWGFLYVLWLPYQKLIPHRSWLSHGLIIGPLLRIVYFAVVLTLALWLILSGLSRLLPLDAGGVLGTLLSGLGRSLVTHPDTWTVGFVGFMLGGTVHSVADGIWTWWRHVWRRPQVAGAHAADEIVCTHHGEPMEGYVERISLNTRDSE
jgi:uncharacterized metal-binding protein